MKKRARESRNETDVVREEDDERDGSVSPKKRFCEEEEEEEEESRVKKDLRALIEESDKNETFKGNLCFCQLADTQLGMIDRDDWSSEVKTARMAVDAINKLRPKPAFVIVCGDLVDAYPNGPRANKRKYELQNKDFQRVMSHISHDIRLVCVCGNHDVGDRITKGSIASWRKMYGSDYWAFSKGGCRCIMLNSSLLAAKNPLIWRRGFFPHLDGAEGKDFDLRLRTLGADADVLFKKQDAWLDKELSKDSLKKHKHVIVFSHIPPFLYRVNEPKGYFNLEMSTRKNILNKLKRAGVTHWFCGHFHRNAGGCDESLEVVVTRAVGCVLPYAKNVLKNNLKAEKGALGLGGLDFKRRRCDPDVSGFRLVSIQNDGIIHRFVTLNEVHDHIARNNLSVKKIVGKGDQISDLTREMEQRLILPPEK